MKIAYDLKDISVIIATYNRDKDLSKAINSFKEDISKLKEVLIVDQSTNKNTYNLIRSLKNKNIRYLFSKIPSLTKARNMGIKNSNNDAKIIIFLDDDVTLENGYFNEIIKVFNEHKDAIGASGYYFPKEKKVNSFENQIRKLFFLEHWTPNRSKVLSVYGAGYPSTLNKTINASWISGFNMAFKRDVFKNMYFDEALFRYALAEDFEFSTRLLKSNKGKFFITPYAKLVHHASITERMPTQKIAYMNHINHFYIQAKLFNEFIPTIKWANALCGMSLLHLTNALCRPNKKNIIKCIFHFRALGYCFRRLGKIRNGDLELPISAQ